VNQGIVKNKTVDQVRTTQRNSSRETAHQEIFYEKQVRVRIKNKRCTIRKSSQCEAIDYFITFNQAPRISHTELQHYDPSLVVSPRFSDPLKLPQTWKIFFNVLITDGKAAKHEKVVKAPKPAFFRYSIS
jgi:hypothetical protein